jgi:hypothetical protein
MKIRWQVTDVELLLAAGANRSQPVAPQLLTACIEPLPTTVGSFCKARRPPRPWRYSFLIISPVIALWAACLLVRRWPCWTVENKPDRATAAPAHPSPKPAAGAASTLKVAPARFGWLIPRSRVLRPHPNEGELPHSCRLLSYLPPHCPTTLTRCLRRFGPALAS